MANLLPFSSFSPSANTDLVLYDTNMAVSLVGSPTESRKLEARTFTANLASSNVYIVTSVKLHEELRIVGASQVLGSAAQQKITLSVNPGAINGVDSWVANVTQTLKALPNYYPEMVGAVNEALVDKATKLMLAYGLAWGDAVHLAIAYEEGLTCIATLDGDFSRVKDPNLTIFTDSANYSKHVRPPLPPPITRPVKPGGST